MAVAAESAVCAPNCLRASRLVSIAAEGRSAVNFGYLQQTTAKPAGSCLLG